MEIKVTKPHLLHKEFTLPKGCSVESFVMREIDGQDERDAGRWLAARGSSVEDPRLALMDEQLRVSIVAVNGKGVDQPFQGMDKWSSKTRRFVLEAFGLLNAVEDDELAVFLGAATELNQNNDQPEAAVLSENELNQISNAG